MPTPAELATPSLDAYAATLSRRFAEAKAEDLLAAAIEELFAGRIALVSSFGADAAVLLHLVASIDRRTPVVFIDTKRHFAETLAYRDALVERLGLEAVRSVRPNPETESSLDPDLTLAARDPDACCAFRKVGPLETALKGFDAWISGRKRHQAATRANVPFVEADGERIKINPLAAWSATDVARYQARHDLPPHPLAALGFTSIGCEPCTRAVGPSEDPRAGRWAGFAKTECGIHRPRSVTKDH